MLASAVQIATRWTAAHDRPAAIAPCTGRSARGRVWRTLFAIAGTLMGALLPPMTVGASPLTASIHWLPGIPGAAALTSQTITFGILTNRAYGVAPFAVSASASSGLVVTFSSTTTTICSVSGSTVTIKAVGTCTIRAAQAGNATYSAAPTVDQSFTVAKGSQTITFGALSPLRLDQSPFTLSATASSGLTVTFTSATTTICTVSSKSVTLKAVGTCTVQAAQAGNANYNVAPNVPPELCGQHRAIKPSPSGRSPIVHSVAAPSH